MIRTNSAEKSSLNIANPIREEAKKHRTPLFSLSLMGPREGAPRMLITPPTIHQYSRFIFLWRSIDFLLFSLPLIPGSVSSVAFYRGAIIRGLITTPLAAYLLPGDSLFKPLPNDLGKLTCSTSQGCGASLMSEGVAPMQGLLVLLKKKRERERKRGRKQSCQSLHHTSLHLPSTLCHVTQVAKANLMYRRILWSDPQLPSRGVRVHSDCEDVVSVFMILIFNVRIASSWYEKKCCEVKGSSLKDPILLLIFKSGLLAQAMLRSVFSSLD